MERLLDFYRHRALVGVLVARELKARYRGSALGFLWSLLNPLLMLTVYTVVFQYLLPNRTESTRPYALFLFCGLLPWNWFSSAVSDAAASLLTHGALLRKILFPAEVLPAVCVLAQAVHFALALPVLLGALLLGAAGVFPGQVRLSWPLLQIPALVLVQGVLLLGLGLLLSALTVHFRDVKDLLQTVLSLWFFATPILYTLADIKVPGLARALSLNPLAPLFAAWHDTLFYGRWVPAGRWGVLAVTSAAVFAAGYGFFDRLRDSFPEAV